MRFWDASAIVPLLVSEPMTPSLMTLLAEDDRMLVWWGTPVECTSALARREREGALSRAACAKALTRLRTLGDEWQEILPGDPVRIAAQRLLRLHPLRAADALQLGAALVACEHDPASLPFVCLDDRLSEAAEREGFEIARS